MAMSCGGSASTAPPTTVGHTAVYTGSAFSWLSTKARPWNKKLNDDQKAVNVAAASRPANPTGFFTRLASACSHLADDSRSAGQVQKAPTASLAAAWTGMTDRTRIYANDCLALARTHSNADLTRWNTSLDAMDSANAALNADVDAVRSASGESPG
jgi:hypothetical protein